MARWHHRAALMGFAGSGHAPPFENRPPALLFLDLEPDAAPVFQRPGPLVRFWRWLSGLWGG